MAPDWLNLMMIGSRLLRPPCATTLDLSVSPERCSARLGKLFPERPRDNRFNPQEPRPKGRAYVIREQDGVRGWDVIAWDMLGGQTAWPMTNVRNLKLLQ